VFDGREVQQPEGGAEVIPAALTQLKRWAYSDDVKAPHQPGGAMAKINDATTWSTYEQVAGLGIGAALLVTPDAGLVVVDLDGCIDENGNICPAAQKIVVMLDSYTEISISGRGLHIVVRGAKPPVQKPWTKIALDGFVVEMFDYHPVTLTGNHLPGTPDDAQARQQQITEVYFHVAEQANRPATNVNGDFPPARTPYMPDNVIVDLIKKSKQGPKFDVLMTVAPDDVEDASALDARLFGIIAFWTQDPEQIVRIASKSALAERVKNGQVKWEREDYIERTLHLVLDNREEKDCYKGGEIGKLELVPLSTIKATTVPWLWPGYIARGEPTIFLGDPGDGKTLDSLDFTARITVGAKWPDGTPNAHGPRNVIVLSAEDANEYTIKPRVVAAGGDPSRVFVIPAERVTKLSLETDVERIHTVMQEINPLAIVLDPLSAYMPKVDTHRDNEVRSALARFVALLKTTGTAAIFIIHMSKNVERTAMQRILGSTAFGALSRAAFLIARHPDHDPAAEDDGRRVFVPTKFNLGRRPAGRSFVIESTMVEVDGIRIEAPVARWSAEAVKMHADEVLRQLARGPVNTKEIDEAIKALLADGPMTTKDIEQRTGKGGTTLRRAKDRLHIIVKRDPAEPMTGAYYWLPPDWDHKRVRAWETERTNLRQPPTSNVVKGPWEASPPAE
jgi:hypothetical protein